MANVSRPTGDLTTHPDVYEMQARYYRVLKGRDVMLVDGPVFLAGLYLAVSPWILHFTANQPDLVTHNLIVGIAIAVLALGFTVTPSRMYGLSWAMCVIGGWIIASSWAVGTDPDAGIIWNNAVVGGVVILLGLASAALVMKASRREAQP